MARLHLTLESRLSSLTELAERLEQFAEDHSWSTKLLFQTQLALEEIACNVINHGYREEGHKFEIVADSSSDVVTIEVIDSARPFNPLTESRQADVGTALSEREVGGLGVILVKELSDEVKYKRKNGKNHLTFVKRRTP